MKLIKLDNVYDFDNNEFNSYCWINPEYIVNVYPSTISKFISSHYVELLCTRIEMVNDTHVVVNETVEDVLKDIGN